MRRKRHSPQLSRKAVILLSGGVDSVTTLYLARERHFRLWGLIFDYGQRHRKEIECARYIAHRNHVPYRTIRITLPWIRSALTRKTIKVPSRRVKTDTVPVTYVSGRNIIFLSYAFSFAESIGAEKIFIGAHVQDYSGYPDCRPEFLYQFQEAVLLGLKRKNIEIAAPLIDKNKKEIIQEGLRLRVPYQHTWSCYRGTVTPCGECDSCRFRIDAFRALGYKDPLLKI